MKCLKCGAVNNKKNEKCKKCGENLHFTEKQEIKSQVNEEKRINNTIEIKKTSEEKKKINIFKKFWTFIKIIILLTIVAVIALIVYVYAFYDYKQYFNDNMNRYYKSESSKYLENIKLVSKIYGYNDEKMEDIQDSSREIIEKWIEDIRKKEYSSTEEYVADLNYLQKIIESLYNDTLVNEHTTISKKTYISLSYKVKDLINDVQLKDENNSLNNEQKPVEKKYDISMMNELDLNELLDLFESKKTYVLYIGRESCGACIDYLPTLQQAQDEYGYKTQYFDINKLDKDDNAYREVVEKLSYEYEMYYDGEIRKNTFGNWLGFTPMTIIIKDGKQVDGEIGAIDYTTLTKMLDENNIKKK